MSAKKIVVYTPEEKRKENVAELGAIGGMTATGAVIGGLIGGPVGAIIGAALLGGAGLGAAIKDDDCSCR